MRKTLLLIAVSLLTGSLVFSQDYPPGVTSTFEYTAHLRTQLTELEGLAADQYLGQVDRYRVGMERYFDHKKRVCEGEFSSLILSERREELDESRPRRMSREEQELCFNELKALQSTYINNLYNARERYLTHLHEQRINDLKAARQKALDDLEASFSTRRR